MKFVLEVEIKDGEFEPYMLDELAQLKQNAQGFGEVIKCQLVVIPGKLDI